MATNEQAFHPEAPAFARSRPDAYYAWLTSNGFPHQVAYDQTTAIFGAPKTPEQIQKEQAAAAQKSGLAQTGGVVGGALLAREAVTGFPTVSGLFSSAPAAGAGTGTATTTTGALAVPKVVGVKALGAGGAQAGAGASAGGASGGATFGSVALPVAIAAATINNAWETGMKDIVRGRGDRADWTNQAANMVLGAGPNIALRLLGKRSIGAMMKSGKSGAQRLRDNFRGDLKEANVADDKYNVTLADGTKFNIGLDGKTKYQNVGKNVDGKTTRNAWDVDFSNPLAKFASDKIDPMIRGIYGADDPKAKFFPGQYTGMLVNAVTSNAKSEADVMANIETMLGKSKFAQQAGVGVTPPPPAKAAKGQVVRVSPGMYVNDRGQVKPAQSTRQALESNYNKSKKKEKK
jgi:hypothetical protein